ncbi:MAG: MATE family efflux transporter [Halieaceae bacterium]|nr:MAG: MATE family efflux transporter [Halieaceae bacterium]
MNNADSSRLVSQMLAELRPLWRIAWPLLIAQTAQIGTGVVDTLMAGNYGDVDLAAIAVGFNIWLPLYLIILGTLFACSAIVAQDFGAGRIERVRSFLPQGLWVAVALSAVMTPLCLNSDMAITLLGLPEETAAKTSAYVSRVGLGFPALGIFMALRYHTQGLGITAPFAFASVVGFIANVPLNYMLIFGAWGAPELGAEGCGLATAASMWISTFIILLYVLTARSLQPYLPTRWLEGPDWGRISEILVVGLPVGLTFFLETGVFSAITLLIATLGDAAVAAHQIAINVWDVFYIPMVSVGSAMATRMGHAIGARNAQGVRMALWVGAALSTLIGLLAMSLLLLFPDAIIGAYTQSEDIRELALKLLRLAALFIMIDVVQIVGSFVLRAYKETRFPFIVVTLSYWGLALPLGYLLAIHWGDSSPEGTVDFWYTTILGIAVAAALITWRVRRILRLLD